MDTTFVIETHIYAEETLNDDILDGSLPDDVQTCGILGPEIVLPLRRNRYCELDYEYTGDTTLRDVKEAVLERLESVNSPISIAFLIGSERYWIGDLNARLSNLIQKYLDLNKEGRIRVGAYVSSDAGIVSRDGKLRYYMYSRESGRHKRPHVHVRTASYDYEASIDIESGEVLAGKLPGKLLKTAQKKISSEKEYFMKCWYEKTDGLCPDINRHYNYIKY